MYKITSNAAILFQQITIKQVDLRGNVLMYSYIRQK